MWFAPLALGQIKVTPEPGAGETCIVTTSDLPNRGLAVVWRANESAFKNGDWKTMPGLSIAFMIFLLSMAGIPPLAGCLGKFYLLKALSSFQVFNVFLRRLACSVPS